MDNRRDPARAAQVKRPRGRPKGIHTPIKLNPELTKFLAEKLPAKCIAELQGVGKRRVDAFFKQNDINPTLEELRSGLTEEFLKTVRKGLRLQNR